MTQANTAAIAANKEGIASATAKADGAVTRVEDALKTASDFTGHLSTQVNNVAPQIVAATQQATAIGQQVSQQLATAVQTIRAAPPAPGTPGVHFQPLPPAPKVQT